MYSEMFIYIYLLQSTTQDLFELLERVQSSRLDDQRCVLPSYFSQVRFVFIPKHTDMRTNDVVEQIIRK